MNSWIRVEGKDNEGNNFVVTAEIDKYGKLSSTGKLSNLFFWMKQEGWGVLRIKKYCEDLGWKFDWYQG